jgi:hypothetical protein
VPRLAVPCGGMSRALPSGCRQTAWVLRAHVHKDERHPVAPPWISPTRAAVPNACRDGPVPGLGGTVRAGREDGEGDQGAALSRR